MQAKQNIRVLRDIALDGPTNMARDEALMLRVGTGDSPPTLRLYQWDPPTISLGYFQPYTAYEELPPPAGSLPVVRRLTGGGAILHDLELTYSLTLPIKHPLVAGKPRRLYDMAHEAVIDALGGLDASSHRCGFTDDSGPSRGPFFCFSRRHEADVLMDGRKVAGSAQRRTQTAILQHGSIVLGNRFSQQDTGEVSQPFDEAVALVRAAFESHLMGVLRMGSTLGDWTEEELSIAAERISKYAGAEWTRRR